MILVTGATGTVGREVVRALAARGVRARAGVRDPERARRLFEGLEVELVPFDYDAPATWAGAFAGASALFSVTPLVAEPVATARAAHEAAARSRIGHVVRLSSRATGWDRVSVLREWHRAIEADLDRLVPSVTHLRPCSFFQNLVNQYAAEIRARDRLVLPLGEGRISYVDAVDIGEVAASCLLAPKEHGGRIHVLTGPEALSGHDLADAIGRARGKPVAYVAADPERVRERATAAGTPAWLVDSGLRIFARARDGGEEATVVPAVPAILGRPARGLEAFARANADVFRPGAASA